MDASQDSIAIGINFVRGERQPFVHFSVELEHHLKTVSIKKSTFNLLSNNYLTSLQMLSRSLAKAIPHWDGNFQICCSITISN